MNTKYYYRANKEDRDLTEIPLDKEHWFYIMLDSSVRTAFMKYDVPLPKYGIIHKINSFTYITLYRQDLEDIKQAEKWMKYRIYVMDELRIQAEANSHVDEDIVYKFEIL